MLLWNHNGESDSVGKFKAHRNHSNSLCTCSFSHSVHVLLTSKVNRNFNCVSDPRGRCHTYLLSPTMTVCLSILICITDFTQTKLFCLWIHRSERDLLTCQSLCGTLGVVLRQREGSQINSPFVQPHWFSSIREYLKARISAFLCICLHGYKNILRVKRKIS